MNNKKQLEIVQLNLFTGFSSGNEESEIILKEQLLPMPDASVTLYRDFFKKPESDDIFNILSSEIKWRQDKISFYGKVIDLPRKTAWYGDSGKSYTFSGIKLIPKPWIPILLKIKARIEPIANVRFNSVLLNLYRDGNDGISWHSDAEPELGQNPTIASVSFGESRRFLFKHKYQKDLKEEIDLTHGSFLLMSGTTQHFWQHQIPKTKKKVNPRINLTFRTIF